MTAVRKHTGLHLRLKFDIAAQQMPCSHCSTAVDPYSIQKEQDAEESSEYDVTVFRCTQCGAA